MHTPHQEVCGQFLEGQESAAAADLAASAAHLRYLMQKLISARPQSNHQDALPDYATNHRYAAEDAISVSTACGEQVTDRISAQATSSTAGQNPNMQICSSPKTTQTTAPTAAPSSPGMAALAAQARDLLLEIEAAAASSPCSSNQVFAEQLATAQTQHSAGSAVAVRRQLPFATPESDTEHRQSRLGAASQVRPTAAEAVGSTAGLTGVHGTAADNEVAVPASGPNCSRSLADSHTWSKALHMYQLQQQQGLLLQTHEQKFTNSCTNGTVHSVSTAPAAGGHTSCIAQSATQLVTAATVPNATTPLISALNESESAEYAPQQPGPCTGSTAATNSCAQQVLTSNINNIKTDSPPPPPPAPAASRPSCKQTADNRSKAAPVTAVHPGDLHPELHSQLTYDSSSEMNAVSSADGVRLRVKALRGPLEDAMRCFTQLQEVQENAAQLRAHNARLQAEARTWQAERDCLLAERKLHVAQLRHLAVQLTVDSDSSKRTAAAASQLETVQEGLTEAEQQAQAYRHLLPLDSLLRSTTELSYSAASLAAERAKVQAAVAYKQQQVTQLSSKLQDTQGQLLQQQKRSEQLQQQLVGHVQAAEVAKLQDVAAVQAKAEKKLLRAEHKLLKLAQVHRAVVAKHQQQVQEHQDQLSTAEQQRQLLQAELQATQQQMKQLENHKAEAERSLQAEKQKRSTVEDQVRSLQREQSQLLSAMSALEASLSGAQEAAREEAALRQRCEAATQAKAAAAAAAKQELREVKLTAQTAQSEVQHLQQQLSSLKSRSAESARQLSAARTAAQQAQQELAAQQKQCRHQDVLLEELRSELDKARRAAIAAQKAQATEAKRAAAAESAATSALQAELLKSQAAAAEAQNCLTESRQHCIKLQHEHELLQQQCNELQQHLNSSRAELQRSAEQYEALLADMQQRATAAEADLMGIRQDVAGWVALRSCKEQPQANMQKELRDGGIAAARGDLNAAHPDVCYNHNIAASSSVQQDLEGLGRSKPGAAASMYLPAADGYYDRIASKELHVQQQQCNWQQQQQEEESVTAVQLRCQALEVSRLQTLLQQVQEQLHESQQQLNSSQAELHSTKQQLAAAEEALARQQREQQQQHQLYDQADAAAEASQQRQQQLQVELSAAEGRIAELTLEVAAAKAELVQQQRKHSADVELLEERLQFAEYTRGQAQQQLQQLQEEYDQQQQRMIDLLQRRRRAAAAAGKAYNCDSSSGSIGDGSKCPSEADADYGTGCNKLSNNLLHLAQRPSQKSAPLLVQESTKVLDEPLGCSGQRPLAASVADAQLVQAAEVNHLAAAELTSYQSRSAVSHAAAGGSGRFTPERPDTVATAASDGLHSQVQNQIGRWFEKQHNMNIVPSNGDLTIGSVGPQQTSIHAWQHDRRSGVHSKDLRISDEQQLVKCTKCSSDGTVTTLQPAAGSPDFRQHQDGITAVHQSGSVGSRHDQQQQGPKPDAMSLAAASTTAASNASSQRVLAIMSSQWDTATSGSVDYEGVMAAANAALEAAAAANAGSGRFTA